MGAACCTLRDSDKEDTSRGGASSRTDSASGQAKKRALTVATWNLSAVNTNPFEYYISHDDADYNKLMAGVESFIDSPGDRDVLVSEVFGDSRFAELKSLMAEKMGQKDCIEVVEKLWKEDFRNRKIISGFLKDKDIGSKRLASMPDRFTNTIRLATGSSSLTACRPTIINNYVDSLDTMEDWWSKWKSFMFTNGLSVPDKDRVGQSTKYPYELLAKISRAKYPALTEQEEEVSRPLQALCLAIFDAIMVHIMLTLSPDGGWQQIKQSIVDAIYDKKDKSTLQILGRSCAGIDVICLQECAAAFCTPLREEFGAAYHILLPEDIDMDRNQNSLVLLRKEAFPNGVQAEVTGDVLTALSDKSSVAKGDICAFTAARKDGSIFLIVSFHGDTNGLATKPVVSAVAKVLEDLPKDCQPLIGLDANVYLKKKEGMQHVDDFLDHCKTLGLRSCWREDADLGTCCTTCSARTFLQPQLNKAVKISQKLSHGDVNPKDHILFRASTFEIEATFKDNTGNREYTEKECFPSLQFPSDHGIVGTILRSKVSEAPADKEVPTEYGWDAETKKATGEDDQAEPKATQDVPLTTLEEAKKKPAETAAAKKAAEEAAVQKAGEEQESAQRKAAEEAEAKKASDEKQNAESKAAQEGAAKKAAAEKEEAERKDAEEAAAKKAAVDKEEAERKAAEEATAKKAALDNEEAERKAAEEAAAQKAASDKIEAERKAAEEAAAKKAAEDKIEAERKAAEEAAAKKAASDKIEAERKAAEEAAVAKAAEEEEQADRKAVEEDLVAVKTAADVNAEVERLAAEEEAAENAGAEKAEAERKAAEAAAADVNEVDAGAAQTTPRGAAKDSDARKAAEEKLNQRKLERAAKKAAEEKAMADKSAAEEATAAKATELPAAKTAEAEAAKVVEPAAVKADEPAAATVVEPPAAKAADEPTQPATGEPKAKAAGKKNKNKKK